MPLADEKAALTDALEFETLDFSAANNWRGIYVIICGGRGNGMSIMIDLPPAMAQEARGVRRSATRKSKI